MRRKPVKMLSIRIEYTILVLTIAITEVQPHISASVFRIIPKKHEDIKVLYSLDKDVDGIGFWKDPAGINRPVDLMVPKNHTEIFEAAMREHELSYSVKVPDVQQLLNNATIRRKRASTYPAAQFDFGRFHDLDEIYGWLDHLAQAYPQYARTIVGGKSHEGRPIKGVFLSFAAGRSGVFIEAGIHAREWLAPSTATFLINELLSSDDRDVRQLAESFDWYIFPCLNPDGYQYTHSNPYDHDVRLWRKSRRPYAMGNDCSNQQFCAHQTCLGTDLNRNWGFQWRSSGSSHLGCTEVFSGPGAFSEVETRSIAEYISTVSDELFAYISFHSYIQKLMFPYGHTSAHLDNYDEQYTVGLQAINGLSKRYGTRFSVGNIGEILGGPVGGGSIDWVKAKFQLPFVYVYELRGETRTGQTYGFLAPPSEIIPTGQEVVDSLVAMFKAAAHYYPRLKREPKASRRTSTVWAYYPSYQRLFF